MKNTWPQFHRSECELDRCTLIANFAKRSRILPFECEHIQSLHFCTCATDSEEFLSESALDHREEILKRQQEGRVILTHDNNKCRRYKMSNLHTLTNASTIKDKEVCQMYC